jgi:hypothetical protein
VSISSREFTGPASGRTAQPAQPAKALSGKPPTAIHQGITHTREQLADTVEALAHKIDLPVRVKDRVQQTKDTVQTKVDEVRQHLHKGTETLQDKAGEVRSLTNQALVKVPAPVGGRIKGLGEMVRYRPVSAAAVVLGVLMVLRRLLRSNK